MRSLKRESPDFLVSDGQGRFGLEVAQIFRDQCLIGSPAKAAESRRVQYLRRLASEYYSESGLPLLVKANIPDRFDLDTSILVDRLKVEHSAVPWTRSQFEMKGATFYLTSLPSRGRVVFEVVVRQQYCWLARMADSRRCRIGHR